MCFTRSFNSLSLQAVCRRLKLKMIETFFSVCLILALEAGIREVSWWVHAFSWPKLIFTISYCCGCEIVRNSVCGILVTRRAGNKFLTTVE